MRFLANDCPRERKGMYFACTRYYFPATLPNIQFTFPLNYRIFNKLSCSQRCFCFSVCFEIYFPAANKICEFIWKNCSYSKKVLHSICLFAGKEFGVSSLLVVLRSQSISHCYFRKKFIFS
jgi:hypothetical protein